MTNEINRHRSGAVTMGAPGAAGGGVRVRRWRSFVGAGVGSLGAGASSKPTLTIWYDTARKPMVEAYIEAHPDVHVVAVLKDGDSNGDGTYQSALRSTTALATAGRTSTSASRTTTRRRSRSPRSMMRRS